MNKYSSIAFAVFTSLLLAACGNKAALYLAAEPLSESSPVSTAPEKTKATTTKTMPPAQTPPDAIYQKIQQIQHQDTQNENRNDTDLLVPSNKPL